MDCAMDRGFEIRKVKGLFSKISYEPVPSNQSHRSPDGRPRVKGEDGVAGVRFPGDGAMAG